jgi:RNA recognition motif-containing protein
MWVTYPKITGEFVMGKKVYVGNMSYEMSQSDLETMFGDHGTVESAQIINDRATGRSKGFGFIEMSSDEEAQAAIGALDGKDCGGRALKVNEAKPRPSGGGGGYGGGDGSRSRY